VFVVSAVVFVLSLAFAYRHDFGRGFTDADDFDDVFLARRYMAHPSNLLLDARDGLGYRPLGWLYITLGVSLLGANPHLLLVRNFALFLISIWLVFSIAYSLSESRLLSLGASVLFAFHPANVNVVSVASWGYAPLCAIALLVVRLLVPIANEDVGHSARRLPIAWVSWSLATLLPFAAETFLWLLPVQALLFFWVSRRTKVRAYIVLGALCLAVLLGHVLLRYLLIGARLVTAGSGGTYGLKTPLTLLVNLGSLYAGFGSVVDPVLLFNPVDQALPRSVAGLVLLPGVTAALILSALVSASVLLWAFAVWLKNRSGDAQRTAAPLVLLLLSLCSVSVVSAGSLASETYLFTGTAMWSIAAVLLVGGLLGRTRVKANSAIVTAGIVALSVVVISLRFAGTANRNHLLADKAKRIAYLQAELRAAAGDFGGKDLYLVPESPFPRGYSIYGGRSLSMVRTGTFVAVTLDRYDIWARQLDPGPCDELPSDSARKVLLVDIEGNMWDPSVGREPTATHSSIGLDMRHAPTDAPAPDTGPDELP
jgi:hypothetical protein